jgi:hypothetical protein
MLSPELRYRTFKRSLYFSEVVRRGYKFRCSYTPKKEDDGFFYVHILRVQLSTKHTERIKVRKFRSRWKAKDFCYKQWCKYKGKEFVSIHRPRASNLPANFIPQKGQNPFEQTYLCVSNVGMEDFFDLGVEYLAIPAKRDDNKEYILAENKFGEKMRVLKERFKESNGEAEQDNPA